MTDSAVHAEKRDGEVAVIPYYLHELRMFRMERKSKRLTVAVIVTLILLIGTNAAWVINHL